MTYADDCNGFNEGAACVGPDAMSVTADGKGGFVLAFDGEFRSSDNGRWARRLDAEGNPAGDVRRIGTLSSVGPPIAVLPGPQRSRIYVDATDKHIHLGACDDATCPAG